MDSKFKKVYAYSISLLSRRDYSPESLKRKISEKFPEIENQTVDSVIAILKREKFLDEFRTAYNYFISKMEKRFSYCEVENIL